MNIYLRICVLFALFLSIAMNALGQPGEMEIQDGIEILSEDYLGSFYYQTLYHSNNLDPILKLKKSLNKWVVWADRDQARIFNKINGVTPVDRADFLEEFRVIEVNREGWFFVGRQTIAGLEPAGWMHASSLLLHQRALRNQYAGAQKNMILTPLSEEVQNAASLSEVVFASFLRKPERSSKVQGEARRFSIFFVLKKEKDREGEEFALLASSSFITPTTARNEVLGWIPVKALTEWDSRVGLDFAAGSKAGAAYDETPIVVANDDEGAMRFHRNQTVRNPILSETISKSPRTEITSTPLPDVGLTDAELHIHKVVAILQTGVKGKDSGLANDEVRNWLESLQRINLFFVIDGTKSMQPYLDVVKSLASNVAKFNESRGKNGIRMGFAVYRDFPDGVKVSEEFGVTSDIGKFQDAISKITCYSSDRDIPEAFYYGISEGLKQSGMEETQTNLVILIGDVGNHRETVFEGTNYDYNRALEALKNLKASLFIYQVSGGGHSSYMDFGLDAARFARDLDDGTRKMIRQKEGFELERDKNDPFQPYARVYLGNKSGSKASAASLQSTLEFVLDDYISLRDTLTTKIGNAFGVGGKKPDPGFVESICADMVEKGKSTVACELLKSQDVAVNGFVSVQTEDQKVRCFTPYIFFTQEEIRLMNRFMGELGAPITADDVGRQLRDVFLSIATSFSGDDDRSKFEDWNLETLWYKFFQLPCALSFKDVPIKDLPTRLSLSGADGSRELRKEIEDMQEAARHFKHRYGDWQWKPNPAIEEKFYWIPLRYFPGAENDNY